jgi:light-independent protochlorophyllide reductase subunit B
MERHIAKRLGIPCAVISAPVHVQDFPARYSPQMGWEGTQVIFDTWVHPLMMGLEEHLLTMFRGDFEFHDGAAPSHLGGKATAAQAAAAAPAPAAAADGATEPFDAAAPANATEFVSAADFVSAAEFVSSAESASAAESTGRADSASAEVPASAAVAALAPGPAAVATATSWSAEAERELQKIPFFVRGKARRNTERFATERAVPLITLETLYESKAHFSR